MNGTLLSLQKDVDNLTKELKKLKEEVNRLRAIVVDLALHSNSPVK